MLHVLVRFYAITQTLQYGQSGRARQDRNVRNKKMPVRLAGILSVAFAEEFYSAGSSPPSFAGKSCCAGTVSLN